MIERCVFEEDWELLNSGKTMCKLTAYNTKGQSTKFFSYCEKDKCPLWQILITVCGEQRQ